MTVLNKNTWIWIGVAAAVVLVVVLIAVASGGDDDGDDTVAGDTTTTAVAETTTTAAEEQTTTTAAEEETTTTSAEETTTTSAADEPFTIAIVAPSASNDLAFTQSIVDAVALVSGQRGNITVETTDGTFVVEDAAAAIRAYAESGTDLVIAHGSQYGGSLQEIAPDFPDTAFAWGTAADTFGLPNVFAYEAASDEGGYVMGSVGAQLSESGIIGIVGPVEVGDAKLYVDGYALGAGAEGADVRVTYTGSFSDVALASEAANAFAAQGADVMSGTAQMVVGAVTVANDEGILWFGTQANQTSLASSIVVASQVYHWEVVLDDIIDLVQSGTLGGEIYEINLENGGLVIEYNPGYALPDDVRASADATIASIIAGDIATRP
jgi:basic membrane lipoprotein Med (substrate-binding protein (PBP1-ABC) superfamily)